MSDLPASPNANSASAKNALGLRCFDEGKPVEALAYFEQAVAADHGFSPAYRNQGIALQALRRPLDAMSAYRQALQLDPTVVDTHIRLGRLYADLSRYKEAIGCFRSVLNLDPENLKAHTMLAWVLPKEGLGEEAETHLRQLISLDPHSAAAYGMLGFRLQERGQFQEAITNFKQGINLNPRQAGSYYGIVQSKKIGSADSQLVATMEELATLGGFAPSDRMFLHYGLGKAFDDLELYDKAMRHFDEANAVSSSNSKPYDRKGYEAYTERMIEQFSEGFFAKRRRLGSRSAKPVFIVGMPRSGTTLVEQVLSSHPEVGAGGELRFWRDQGEQLRKQMASGKLDEENLKGATGAYLAALQSVSPGARYVTDKMPINFLFLGTVHLALPNAKIIHCRRNAVDTCLSIYMTRYVTPPEFANNRENIVFGYRQYLRLMDHWRTVLPAQSFLEIDYESLVEDPESVIRRMLDFLGLPWSDACLHPEKNARSVATPSLWQVRQPVHGNSVERWRRYEPWLGAFRDLLPR